MPAGDGQGDLRPPEKSHPDHVDERDEKDLRHDRVAQAHRLGDGRVELRPRGVRDQAALEELQHHRPHALVDNQLGQDQQRQRHQKADVQLDVVEERQRDAGPTRVPPRSTERATAPRPETSRRRGGGAATAAHRRRGGFAAGPGRAARQEPMRSPAGRLHVARGLLTHGSTRSSSCSRNSSSVP